MKTAAPTAKSDLQADSARTQLVQTKSGAETNTALVDRRSSVLAQQKRQHMANNSRQATQLKAHLSVMAASPQAMQMRAMAQMMRRDEKEEPLPLAENDVVHTPNVAAQLKGEGKTPNRTGLPDQLKTGIESLSGMSLDHVKVHYNSSQPAQLNAYAYAQGNDIHVGPGQEKHLPHEAWHVVQQAQGRVNPTMQMKDGLAVNDNTGLEAEADAMGAKAAAMSMASHGVLQPRSSVSNTASFAKPAYVAQRYVAGEGGRKTSEHGRIVYRGRQDLLASPDLVRNGNQQLQSSGGHGSMITLGTGDRRVVGGIGLVKVSPEFNLDAYNRRRDTQRGVGFHQRMLGPNRTGGARQQATSESELQAILRIYAAIPAPTEIETRNLQRALRSSGVEQGQIVVGDEIQEPSVSPDGRIALPADCRRAAEAITGTQTGMGYDERRVNVAPPGAATALRGGSNLEVPGERVEGDTTTHRLSMQVYVSSIGPFLLGNARANMLNVDIFNDARFRALVGGGGTPEDHFAERPDFAWKAYTALTPVGKQRFAAFAHINESANPEVGDSYTTVTEYRLPGFRNRRTRGEDGAERADGADIDAWTFHWGGVILKDGEDILTLENYSIGDENATNRNWQFDMYGTRNPEQTFHRRHMASDLHGTIGTTLHVQNVNTPGELRAFIASLAELQRLIGTAGFAVKRLAVRTERQRLVPIYGAGAQPAPAAHHSAVFTQGVAEIQVATRLNRYCRLAGQFVAAIDAADFGDRAAALNLLLASIGAEYRELIRTPIKRVEAANTLHRQINAFRVAVPELEAVIGNDGYQAENERLTVLFNAIPEDRRNLVNAHDIRLQAARTLHLQIMTFRAAIPQLEALAGQDGYDAQVEVLRGLRNAIPVPNRGLIVADMVRAGSANTLHQQINAFRAAVPELEAVIGTDAYQAENERLTDLFNAVPEARRNLVNAHDIRLQAARTLHRQIMTFRAAIPQLEALAGQDGYDAQVEVLRGLRNAIPQPNRELIAADMVRAVAANTLHQQIMAFRAAIPQLEALAGQDGYDEQVEVLRVLRNAIPALNRGLIAADMVRAGTANTLHQQINAFRVAVPDLEAVIGNDGYQAENERLTGLFNAIPEGRRNLVNAHAIRFRAAQAVHQQIIAFRADLPQLEALIGQDGYVAQVGILRGLRDAIPVGNRGLIAVDLERIAAANTVHQQVNNFRAAVVTLETQIGTDEFGGQRTQVGELYNAIPEVHRPLVATHVTRAQTANTVNQQINAFRAAIPQLEALVGQDGYTAQFEILRGLRNAIPEANRGSIAADMERILVANNRHRDN